MTVRTRALTAASAVGLAAMLVALAACGGGDGGDRTGDDTGDTPRATTTAPSSTGAERATTTTATPSGPRALALAAYRASWDATFRALDPPKETPELRAHLTGDALNEKLTSIATRARLAHRVEGSMQTHPQVVSAGATRVVLDDCAVENSTEYDRAGAVVDRTTNATYNFRVTVVHEGDAWKVADFDRREAACTPG